MAWPSIGSLHSRRDDERARSIWTQIGPEPAISRRAIFVRQVLLWHLPLGEAGLTLPGSEER